MCVSNGFENKKLNREIVQRLVLFLNEKIKKKFRFKFVKTTGSSTLRRLNAHAILAATKRRGCEEFAPLKSENHKVK